VLYMATNKYLMDLPVKEVRSFNKEFVKFVNSNYPEIPNEIRATGISAVKREYAEKSCRGIQRPISQNKEITELEDFDT